MKRCGIRKNNRGDSLILVIGCIALLSILGIVILAKTTDNQNMKLVEEKAQKTFFEANSGSSELVTALEAVAQNAIERAFFDMMIEYNLSGNAAARESRFDEFFVKAVEKEIKTGGTAGLELMLANALGVSADALDLNVSYTEVIIDPAPTPVPGETLESTRVVRIKDAVFSYKSGSSETTITTDICIQAKIPNVEAGFRTAASCTFSDFALIADGTTAVTTSSEPLQIMGNLYVGENLNLGDESTSHGAMVISNADKMLVWKEISIQEDAELQLTNTVALNDGEGLWADGIYINGGKLSTDGTNLYVSDDLEIEGADPEIVLKGAGAEYFGYSGGDASALPHEKSSAIAINTVRSRLNLDMSQLGKLRLNGTSYILEPDWISNEAGVDYEVGGVLQGESIAYKDMQVMYLVPGECLSGGHNPVLGNESVSMTSTTFSFPNAEGGTSDIDLDLYLDEVNPILTRIALLDGGVTKAKYVYMNFKNTAAAVQFAHDYLSSYKGTEVKSRIQNLGSGSEIKLPLKADGAIDTEKIFTKGNVMSYVSGVFTEVTASAADLNMLSMIAKQRYNSLFSSLALGVSSTVDPTKKMVANRLVTSDAINALSDGVPVELTTPNPGGGTPYRFVAYKGNLVIDDSSPYKNLNGILLVNGNVSLASTNVDIKGVVLATGSVSVTSKAKITADVTAVESLLGVEDVAEYFRGTASDGSGEYLSSEAVDITFENWKKN